MEIGIIGLGRMGAGMARRRAGRACRVPDHAECARGSGWRERRARGKPCRALRAARRRARHRPVAARGRGRGHDPRFVPLCSAGDTIVDCGNSYYKDSMRRALGLSQQGLRYIDAGVSGGIHGLEGGYCLMLGGTPKSIEIFEPFAKLLASHAERGWLHCGPSGAGHFAKMIHNGIEYGMMQALAEGFALLAARRSSTSTSRASPRPGATAAWCAPGCSICASTSKG